MLSGHCYCSMMQKLSSLCAAGDYEGARQLLEEKESRNIVNVRDSRFLFNVRISQ